MAARASFLEELFSRLWHFHWSHPLPGSHAEKKRLPRPTRSSRQRSDILLSASVASLASPFVAAASVRMRFLSARDHAAILCLSPSVRARRDAPLRRALAASLRSLTSAAMRASAAIRSSAPIPAQTREVHRRTPRVYVVFHEPRSGSHSAVERPMRLVRMAISAFFIEDSANFVRHRHFHSESVRTSIHRCAIRPMDARTRDNHSQAIENAETNIVRRMIKSPTPDVGRSCRTMWRPRWPTRAAGRRISPR